MPVLHLHREIQNLNKLILQLGGQVEENLRQGIQALLNQDARQAVELLDEDGLVDSLEVRIEEECLKLLALYQPVATDLRYIVSVLKINEDLERIGDLATSLARYSSDPINKIKVKVPGQIEALSTHSREMLNKSLNALVDRDIKSCQHIIHRDKKVDALYLETRAWFEDQVKAQPESAGHYLNIFMAAKDLERIADHACNIAEDIIYLVTGEIVRHHQLDEDEED